MLESADVIVKQTAQDIISNFLPHYIISNASNLKEQLTAIKKADLPVVYITNELWKNNDDIADALQEIGYDYEKRESIPAREFFGISKKFGAVENLRLFVKL